MVEMMNEVTLRVIVRGEVVAGEPNAGNEPMTGPWVPVLAVYAVDSTGAVQGSDMSDSIDADQYDLLCEELIVEAGYTL